MSAVNKVTLGNTLLAESGKRGILKPMDDSGYYKMRAGGFNIPNRGGITYKVNDYIEECSDPNSEFGRRVSMGQMYCELGHPKQYYLENINGKIVRTKITEVFEWIMRLKTVDEQNHIAHIRKVHFDWTGDHRTDPLYNDVEIIGFGPWKDVFDMSMATPDINTAISIRTVTKPQKLGDTTREVDYWATYDVVPEQGMLVACKHLQSGLEDLLSTGFRDELLKPTGTGIVTNANNVIQLCERELSNPNTIARHSGNENFANLKEMLDVLKSNDFYKANKDKTFKFEGVSGLEAFL